MIKTDNQLRHTEKEIARFEAALTADISEVSRDAATGMLADLKGDVAEYAALKRGDMTSVEAKSAYGLPKVIIKARIARGMTQSDLAEHLGVKPQQVQRWEADDYESVSAARLFEIIDVLGVRVQASARGLGLVISSPVARAAGAVPFGHTASPRWWTGMIVTQKKVGDLSSQCGQFTAQLHRSNDGAVMHVQDRVGQDAGVYVRVASTANLTKSANTEFTHDLELKRA